MCITHIIEYHQTNAALAPSIAPTGPTAGGSLQPLTKPSVDSLPLCDPEAGDHLERAAALRLQLPQPMTTHDLCKPM